MYIQSSWYILIAKLCFIYNREERSCRGLFFEALSAGHELGKVAKRSL